MKKLLFSFVFTGSMVMGFGQQGVVDFESLSLVQADTFYNGSDLANGFTVNTNFNSILFSNTYTTSQWGDYWTGFSYTNMTDNTTPGYDNQYSSFVGTGANGSEKYGVYYSSGMVTFSIPVIIDSLKITNTTYSALSMRDGDLFGKQFGSSTNANGDNDGTNGEDFFKVWFIGMDEQSQRTDSVEFYLADFRFSDNNLDYILDTWANVNLQSLGTVKSLIFRFESSDMSFGYINTPTYFALDDIAFSQTLGLSKQKITPFEVYPNPVQDRLLVQGAKGQLNIRNVEGQLLFSQEHIGLTEIDFSAFNAGIYFISIEENGRILTQKVVK